MKKLNKDIFIQKSNEIHHNKFSYELVEYKNVRTPVKIKCPTCGIFEQLPWTHMKGIGCLKCNLQTKESFIQKSIKKHDNKYDYENINFIDNNTKVNIKCKKHGFFEQTPAAHIQGQGCPICFRENKKITTEEFINKANIRHNHIYDYSLSEYKNSKEKIKIICREHGEFNQSPQHHLNGSNCPKCMRIINTDNFISKSNKKHNNIYNYSKTEYKNIKTKVIIACLKHGDFLQLPTSHIQGNGCPICSKSKGEKEIRQYLIDNQIKYEAQKTFKDCKNKNLLPFDFYLVDYNICIEYNGTQHYNSNEYFGGIKNLIYTQNNDSIKSIFCKDNNIKLLIITYNDNLIETLKKLKLNFFNCTS